MSVATLILGESGTGKSFSLKNLPPEKTLILNCQSKPLPFRNHNFRPIIQKNDGNNVFNAKTYGQVLSAMEKTDREIIVIDDWQYLLSRIVVDPNAKDNFKKYDDVLKAGFLTCDLASQLAPNKRVYILAHTETDDMGNTRIKTFGKALNQKITIEGMFTTVLQTEVKEKQNYFLTINNGMNTVKAPEGMFKDELIPNDLALVDRTICEYYGIPTTSATVEPTSTEFSIEN